MPDLTADRGAVLTIFLSSPFSSVLTDSLSSSSYNSTLSLELTVSTLFILLKISPLTSILYLTADYQPSNGFLVTNLSPMTSLPDLTADTWQCWLGNIFLSSPFYSTFLPWLAFLILRLPNSLPPSSLFIPSLTNLSLRAFPLLLLYFLTKSWAITIKLSKYKHILFTYSNYRLQLSFYCPFSRSLASF